jgi:GNAT superfamily N-acetyltransferase
VISLRLSRRIEIVTDDQEIYADISRRFEAHNRRFTNWGGEVFSAVQRENGRIIAAARAAMNMGLVEIRGFWVDEDRRGKGIGAALMKTLLTEARNRGCSRAALDTYSWQALGFYERLGFREYGRLDYPNGTSRHYLQRDLEP